jgi:cardiolipin synthase
VEWRDVAREDRRRRLQVGARRFNEPQRSAAGAIRIGNAVGAAFTNRRVLEPVESRIMLTVGAALLALAILFAKFPRALAYPVVVICIWIAVALLYKGYKLRHPKDRREE